MNPPRLAGRAPIRAARPAAIPTARPADRPPIRAALLALALAAATLAARPAPAATPAPARLAPPAATPAAPAGYDLDRIEPPYAVLIDPTGATHDVPLAALPPGVRPGDRLATLRGPVIADREARAARLAARLARLASPDRVGHGEPMSRRQPDHYTRQAKREGYAARSVYKLEEIDKRAALLRPGMKVLDLGCAPGSWIRYAAQKVGPRGRVVGIDRRAIDFKAPHVTTLVGDIFETGAEVFLDAGGGRFDVVMSDMAPDTCGDRFTDHVRSVELCRRALTIADALGAPGGAFVCKVFEGEDVTALVDEIRARYAKVRRIKPKSTRSESVELFIVAQARRPDSGEGAGE